jgi:hypothetical protein
MQEQNNSTSRRGFIQQSVVVGAGVMLANPIQLFLQTKQTT